MNISHPPALPPRNYTIQMRPLPTTPTGSTTNVASPNHDTAAQQPSMMDRVNNVLAITRAYASRTNDNVFSSPKRSTAAMVSALFGVGIGSCGGCTGAMGVPIAVAGFVASGHLCTDGTASDTTQEQTQQAQSHQQQPNPTEPMQVVNSDQRPNEFLTSNLDRNDHVLPPIPQTRF